MVTFDANPERYNTVRMLRKLESDVENLIDFDNRITAMDEEIILNPRYIKLSNAQGSGASSSVVRAATAAEFDDDVLGNALPSSISRGPSMGPSSSSTVNSNNINYANST